MKRRTFKLTKELPELAKGALVQEKCDDGDQDYTVLDQSFIKYEDEHGRKTVTYPRKAVEDEPSYFVEVFAVEPAYMTQDELDRFEAFKVSVKKPRNVIAQVADGMTSKPVLTKLAMKSLLKGTPASKPRSFTLGEARLDQFVKAWNSSRSVEAVQRKLNISRSTVTVYRSFALRQGRILKTMKRPNTKVA
ncbi:hypothetical protein AS590_25905 [Prescottella equi]|nr:hypothetical protein AS590_25905 [Prescottella equi]